jgi:hypothetical protein
LEVQTLSTTPGVTEEYNGATWTTVPVSLSTARNSLAGFGIQTAALAVGGNIPPSTPSSATEEYDGSLGQEEEVYQQQDLILQEQEFKLLG